MTGSDVLVLAPWILFGAGPGGCRVPVVPVGLLVPGCAAARAATAAARIGHGG